MFDASKLTLEIAAHSNGWRITHNSTIFAKAVWLELDYSTAAANVECGADRAPKIELCFFVTPPCSQRNHVE